MLYWEPLSVIADSQQKLYSRPPNLPGVSHASSNYTLPPSSTRNKVCWMNYRSIKGYI